MRIQDEDCSKYQDMDEKEGCRQRNGLHSPGGPRKGAAHEGRQQQEQSAEQAGIDHHDLQGLEPPWDVMGAGDFLLELFHARGDQQHSLGGKHLAMT